MDKSRLAGKVALITGGARGLGRGYALRLAGLGADIAVIDRNLKGFDTYEFEKQQMTDDTVVEECRALGVRAMGLELDLTDRTATEKAAAEVVRELGSIDIVICNAGGGFVKFADELEEGETGPGRKGESGPGDIVTTGKTSDCPQEDLMRVLDINLMSCMYTCMAAAPYLKKQRSGKIVAVSSMAGTSSDYSYHPYGTAKAAIIHYARQLAQELAPFNITVNSIAPGIIRTGRLGDRSHLSDRIPMGREGTIEDCARVIEFLVTDLSDYVTGQMIAIDGGAGDKP